MNEADTGPRAEQIPPEAPPRQIGIEAEALDRTQTTVERMRLPGSALRRIVLLGIIYLALLAGLIVVFDGETRHLPFLPVIILIAFVFETTDSAAGMGFGTGLAPLLFVFGYDPLQIVPVLLLSETLTGLVAGVVHNEVDNVTFSVRPLNDEMKLLLLLVGTGSVAVFGSVVLTYFALGLSDVVIR